MIEDEDKKQKLDEEEYLEYDENMEYDENEYEIIEVDEEYNEEEYEEVEVEEDEESDPNAEQEKTEEEEDGNESIYPDELTDLRLECLYVGLLFNNPKAISRFYFELPDCHFSDKDILNLYKIIIFREGEAYAPAKAKNGFNLPVEGSGVYELTQQVKKLASQKNYDLEKVYTELKKLFILKKYYIVAPTSSVQKKILEILDYELYAEMTIEEVESAIEQIGVTNRLSQVVLNEDATSFLLAGDTSLSSGVPIPLPILNMVF